MEKNKIIKELERRLQVENANRQYLKRHNIVSKSLTDKLNRRVRKLNAAIEVFSDDFEKEEVSYVETNLVGFKGNKRNKSGVFSLKSVNVIRDKFNENLSKDFISEENNKLLCQFSKAKLTKGELDILIRTVELLKKGKKELTNGLYKFIESHKIYNKTQTVRVMEVMRKLRTYGWVEINDNNEIMICNSYLKSKEGYELIKLLYENEITLGAINVLIKSIESMSKNGINHITYVSLHAYCRRLLKAGLVNKVLEKNRVVYVLNAKILGGKTCNNTEMTVKQVGNDSELSSLFISNKNNRFLNQLVKSKMTKKETVVLLELINLLQTKKTPLTNDLESFIRNEANFNKWNTSFVINTINKLRRFGLLKVNSANELYISNKYLLTYECRNILALIVQYDLTYNSIKSLMKTIKLISDNGVNKFNGDLLKSHKERLKGAGFIQNYELGKRNLYKLNIELLNGKGEPKNEGSD
ncbi:hypothetical protein [Vibrio penaeicida]|uniref:hypothetical protein n=1 Tax=Vibrio penaeicida TaxID=104609 RepID=UPI001CC3BD9B|nr:hypothetical protein [Vibrio penaeicida]